MKNAVLAFFLVVYIILNLRLLHEEYTAISFYCALAKLHISTALDLVGSFAR